MESRLNSPRFHNNNNNNNPSHLPSPTTSSGSSNNNNNNNNNGVFKQQPNSPSTTTTRSDPNPYPTTFVQADTSSFKQVVQMLTGSTNPKPTNPIPPIKTHTAKPKPSSKLYERRNNTSLKNTLLKINPLVPGFEPGSNNKSPQILSPSILDFPSLALSPVTPLLPDPFNRSPVGPVVVDKVAEEKAIAEKGFFLHPSPRDSDPPRLLPLFPLTSPRVSSSSTTGSD